MAKYNKEKLEQAIKNLDNSVFVQLWNDYCDENNFREEKIYPMDELTDIAGLPDNAAECIDFVYEHFDQDSFCTTDEYFNVFDSDYRSTDNPMDFISDDDFRTMVSCIMDDKFDPSFYIKPELYLEKHYRAFKDLAEFKKYMSRRSLGDEITFRPKDCPNDWVETIVTAFSYISGEYFVCLGKHNIKLSELFEHYEYLYNGEWCPFGVED